jgi:hypothetical protein
MGVFTFMFCVMPVVVQGELSTMPITVVARSKGGRTPTASRQASRHETKKTKADVSIMTQTGVRRFS